MLLKKPRAKEKASEEVTKRDCAKSELMLEIEKEFETSVKGRRLKTKWQTLLIKDGQKRWILAF
jgi:hypothetical protein